MAYDFGINFRATSGFVTDGANETYCLPTDTYPTTRGGMTFGWESGTISGGLDRDSGVDRRCAGINYRSNDGTTATFRLDLGNTGAADIHLAVGDYGSDQSDQLVVVKDTNTTVTTINDASISAQRFDDALGAEHTSPANWAANEDPFAHTFASTICRLTIGSSGTTSTCLAHLRVVSTSAVATLSATVSGQSATSVTEGTRYAVAASVGATSTVEATLYKVTTVDAGAVEAVSTASVSCQIQKAMAATVGATSTASAVLSGAVVYELFATVDSTSAASSPTSRFAYRDAQVDGVSSVSVAMSAVYAMSASVGAASETSLAIETVLGTEVLVGAYAKEHARAYREVGRAGGS